MLRLVALYDVHAPHNIPLAPVFEFITDFKPNIIVIGGDAHDFGAASEWVSDQSRHLDGGIILSNYEELKRIVLNPLHKIAPKAKMKYLIGNHEHWLQEAAARNPNGRGYWEMERNLDLSGLNMELIPLNMPYRASQHLYYIHGHYTNKYHAYKTFSVYHKNIFYGHMHDVQVYTAVSPLDSQPTKAASCGCLCNRNPSYKRNRPNDWVHGFHFCYIDEQTGNFWDSQVIIIDGVFWANGRKYK